MRVTIAELQKKITSVEDTNTKLRDELYTLKSEATENAKVISNLQNEADSRDIRMRVAYNVVESLLHVRFPYDEEGKRSDSEECRFLMFLSDKITPHDHFSAGVDALNTNSMRTGRFLS